MIIAFIAASIVLGMFFAYIWSSSGALNTLVKMLCTIYTLWAILMMLGQLTPLINNGTLRLI